MPFDGTPITSPDIELLEKVREFLRNRSWTQDGYARTADGNLISPECDNAVSFCLLGAYRRVINGGYEDGFEDHFANLLGFVEDADLVEWNDTKGRTKRAVLQKLSKRITKLKARLLEKALSDARITSEGYYKTV